MQIVLCLLLALVAAPAWAEWVEMDKNDEATFYIDPATIKKTGNFRKVRELQDLKKRQEDGDISRQALKEYDCKEKRSRLLSFSFHSEPMAGGKVLLSTTMNDRWRSIETESAVETLLKHVCAK
jgi:hypothetical protein